MGIGKYSIRVRYAMCIMYLVIIGSDCNTIGDEIQNKRKVADHMQNNNNDGGPGHITKGNIRQIPYHPRPAGFLVLEVRHPGLNLTTKQAP
jgi:hypothetical protein